LPHDYIEIRIAQARFARSSATGSGGPKAALELVGVLLERIGTL